MNVLRQTKINIIINENQNNSNYLTNKLSTIQLINNKTFFYYIKELVKPYNFCHIHHSPNLNN